MKNIATATILTLTTLLASAVPVQAQPGTLDTAFGDGGFVVTDLGRNEAGRALALLLDGKVLVAGSSSVGADPQTNFLLTRYTADGVLDSTFGTGGAVTTFFGRIADGLAMAVQPDGRIVVVGRLSDSFGSAFALARYAEDGAPDATFNSTGRLLTFFGDFSGANSVALLPDGRILVGGHANFDSVALARYTPEGALDPTFGMEGKVTVRLGFRSEGRAMVLLPDGKILVATRAQPSGSVSRFGLARFLADGALDATFGDGGYVTTAVSTHPDEQSVFPFTLALQPDGLIVVAGEIVNAVGPSGVVVRYDEEGVLDPTFGDEGIARFDLVANEVAFDSEGRLLLAGSDSSDAAVGRLHEDGTPDETFGNGGFVTLSPDRVNTFGGIALRPSGEIVVAGRASFSNFRSDPSDLLLAQFAGGEGPTAEEGAAPALGLALSAPYPNPTTGATAAAFHLARPGPVRLVLYDVLGREVVVVAEGPRPSGEHAVTLDASRLPAGLYVLLLQTESGTTTRRLTVVH